MKSHYSIRLGKKSDLAAVLALDEALFRYDAQFDPTLDPRWSRSAEGRKFFRDRLAGDGALWVVDGPEGALAGFLVGALAEPEPYRTVKILGEIEAMFVAETARGHGLGTRLIRAFKTWCRGQGVRRVSVRVSAANARARVLYERLGLGDWDVLMEGKI